MIVMELVMAEVNVFAMGIGKGVNVHLLFLSFHPTLKKKKLIVDVKANSYILDLFYQDSAAMMSLKIDLFKFSGQSISTSNVVTAY